MTEAEAPFGCHRCGRPERNHSTWYTATGKHEYEQPTTSQMKARMLSRRTSGVMMCEECPPQVTCGSVVCTVRRSLWNYPMMHRNRTDVLHYLFCVIGNGFEWSADGRLLENGYEVYPDEYGLKGVQPDPDGPPWAGKSYLDEQMYAEMKADRDAEQTAIAEIRATVDTLARTPGAPLNGKVYGESPKYARLYTMPDNATPDWRAAAAEISAIVEPVWAQRRAENEAVEAAPAVADRLRAAADLIDKRAAAATPGPWWRPLDVRNKASVFAALPDAEQGRWIDGWDPFLERRENVSVLQVSTWSNGRHARTRSGRDLEWAAMMNPLTGPPMAALLRREADRIAPMYKQAQVEQVDAELLALAAAILASNEDRPPSQ